MEVPPRTLVGGIPAKIMRELEDQEIGWKSEGTGHYQHLARRHLATGREVEPLTSPEPDRPRVPDLVGLVVDFQYGVLDPGGALPGVSLTGGLEIVGGR